MTVREISRVPVNKAATPKAKELMAFLVERYQKGMLSGQQDYSNLNWINENTGRKPANAWFAVIEKGDGMASISADIGGRQNSYNHVHATFSLRGEDELEMYTSQKMQEIQLLSDEPFRGDIQVRYHFLHGEDGSGDPEALRHINRHPDGPYRGTGRLDACDQIMNRVNCIRAGFLWGSPALFSL